MQSAATSEHARGRVCSVAAPPGASMIVVTALPGNDISPDDYNPSQMTDKVVKAHHAAVRHRGRPSKPIVGRPADGRYEIIDGEHELTEDRT